MQSVDFSTLNQLGKNLEKIAERSHVQQLELHRRAGEGIKEQLDANISTSINDSRQKVRQWQIVYIGKGGGYAAVRPVGSAEKAATGQNSPGAVTNAINSGHAVRKPSGSGKGYRARAKMPTVKGRHFYEDTQQEAQRIAMAEASRFVAQMERQLKEGL